MASTAAGVGGPVDGVVDLEALVDLLGVLAYGELTAFGRLAADATFAPTLGAQASLAAMAVAEYGHFVRVREHLAGLGVDTETAMTPFIAALDAFHDQTAPADWLESLVKAYVGDGIAADFYREIANNLPAQTRELVLEVLADTGHADFAVDQVRAAIANEPQVAGRLALWARRIVGEALTQAQRVAADREPLIRLLSGMGDLVAMGQMFGRITERHSKRMEALGLSG